MVATSDSTSPSMGISHNKECQRNISLRYGEICTSCDIILPMHYVSQSSEHGIFCGGCGIRDISYIIKEKINYHDIRCS